MTNSNLLTFPPYLQSYIPSITRDTFPHNHIQVRVVYTMTHQEVLFLRQILFASLRVDTWEKRCLKAVFFVMLRIATVKGNKVDA